MNEKKKEIGRFYTDRVRRLSAEIGVRKTRNRAFVAGELTAFCAALAAFVAWASGGLHLPMLLLCLALLAIYVLVRHFDTANMRETEHLEALRTYYVKENEALEGNFSSFDDGNRFADTSHAFSFDLDIFGRESLFQRISRCVTPGGAEHLAAGLSVLPREKTAILDRQQAITELAEMESWRAEWNCNASAGISPILPPTHSSPTPTHSSLTAHRSDMLPQETFSKRSGEKTSFLPFLIIPAFFASVGLAVAGLIPPSVPTLWAVVQLGVVVGITSAPLKRISADGEQLLRGLRGYIPLVRLADNAAFNSRLLLSLQQRLKGDADALEAFNELRRILDGYDRRGNILGMVLFNILFMSDIFLVRRYRKWHNRYAESLGQWIDTISEIDALVSFATFLYANPDTVMPEISEGDNVVFEARGLRHPFLGDDAVRNDFAISDRNYYIITGANMAGKSTFLRAIGVNYILAMAGMPVFATHFTVGVFNLFTSMRTTDDLQHGISYFNAELLRLKQLLASVSENPPCTLIILDEILKGTNSLDKLNGSRMFLEAVSSMPVSGVIATHDLELSRMADVSSRFHNHCFEIELGESVTYSYKITPGVAKNQNATYLLKRILNT
ncbi:MAG: DNA mismatch repair protein MutS [Prevotellaceae bacterium]|nr:DNA mismatch repair protein MutS [Prevotellaceae bacterium]